MRQGQHMGNRCQPLWQRIPQPLPQRDQRQEMPLGAAVWQVSDLPNDADALKSLIEAALAEGEPVA